MTDVDPWAVAATVTDPELPTLTLADLGVLRDVRIEDDGTVVVEITPTYTGCPAMGVMRADLVHALHRAGFGDVDVRTVLSPAWSTDWISEEGRRRLAAGGIAPPGKAPVRTDGPVPLQLGPPRRTACCPLCGSADTEELSEFGATACKALRRCRTCREPFEHVKEI
jgi:ring-1,2-phenylacetyl-CoA epoxidase subunit PaaD